MSENITITLDDVGIATFEKGNTHLDGERRKVCAIGLDKKVGEYTVKVLFKDEDASNVYDYMTSRTSFRDQITKETISITGAIREFRERTREIVLDNVSSITFNMNIKVPLK